MRAYPLENDAGSGLFSTIIGRKRFQWTRILSSHLPLIHCSSCFIVWSWGTEDQGPCSGAKSSSWTVERVSLWLLNCACLGGDGFHCWDDRALREKFHAADERTPFIRNIWRYPIAWVWICYVSLQTCLTLGGSRSILPYRQGFRCGEYNRYVDLQVARGAASICISWPTSRYDWFGPWCVTCPIIRDSSLRHVGRQV